MVLVHHTKNEPFLLFFLFLLSNPVCSKTLGSAMIIYVSFVFFVPFLASTHNYSAILIYASVVSFVVNRCFSDLFI
jgi:hypothetical protein